MCEKCVGGAELFLGAEIRGWGRGRGGDWNERRAWVAERTGARGGEWREDGTLRFKDSDSEVVETGATRVQMVVESERWWGSMFLSRLARKIEGSSCTKTPRPAAGGNPTARLARGKKETKLESTVTSSSQYQRAKSPDTQKNEKKKGRGKGAVVQRCWLDTNMKPRKRPLINSTRLL